jgi:hypothetical protein
MQRNNTVNPLLHFHGNACSSCYTNDSDVCTFTLQRDTFLCFHGNNVYVNTPKYYVTRTSATLFSCKYKWKQTHIPPLSRCRSKHRNYQQKSNICQQKRHLLLIKVGTEQINESTVCKLYAVKGKAFPVQAWIGPEGSRRLRLPGYSDNRHMKMARFISPTHHLGQYRVYK